MMAKNLLRGLEQEGVCQVGDCLTYGNTETLDVADIDERCAVVIASFDQAAAVDIVRVVIFADRDATGPIGGIHSFEGAADSAISGITDCCWRASIVAKRCIEVATS